MIALTLIKNRSTPLDFFDLGGEMLLGLMRLPRIRRIKKR